MTGAPMRKPLSPCRHPCDFCMMFGRICIFPVAGTVLVAIQQPLKR
jgi:hypothetical protein